MSYFTLLYGDKIEKAPGKKVIPAEEFSTLLSAKEIVEKAQEEAKRFRKETAQKAKKLKSKEKKKGFQEGMESWSKQIAQLELETAHVRDDYRKSLVGVVLQAAKKVVGREIEQKPETVADIVANSLKSVAGHSRVTIYCHKDDASVLEQFKKKLEGVFDRLESLSIQERDDVEPGGVMIETEAGIINAQAETQWRALESALLTLVDRI